MVLMLLSNGKRSNYLPKMKSDVFFLFTFWVVFCLFTSSQRLYSQSDNPELEELVKWSSSIEYATHDSLQVVFHVELAPGWSIYSQHQRGTGPIPTSINISNVANMSFNERSAFASDGYDPIWDLPIKKFTNEVFFTSTAFVRQDLLKEDTVQGNYEYMICDSMQCLPPQWVEFEISIPQKKD